jgi:hypothetical protein
MKTDRAQEAQEFNSFFSRAKVLKLYQDSSGTLLFFPALKH